MPWCTWEKRDTSTDRGVLDYQIVSREYEAPLSIYFYNLYTSQSSKKENVNKELEHSKSLDKLQDITSLQLLQKEVIPG
jgi:hypothetical protein